MSPSDILLRRSRRRIRRIRFCLAFLPPATLAVGLLTLAGLLFWLWEPPLWLARTASAGIWTVFAASLGIAGYAASRPIPLSCVARLLQSRAGETADRLLHALELREIPAGISEALASSARQAGEEFASALQPRLARLLPFSGPAAGLRNFVLSAFAAAGIFLLPGSDPATVLFPQRTYRILRVEPGDRRLMAGEDLEVRVFLRPGRPGPPPRLMVSADRHWEDLGPMIPAEPDVFLGKIRRITRPLRYQVRVGRERSAVYEVEPRPAPAFRFVSIRVSPPAYTGLPEKKYTEDPGSISVPFASRVEWEAEVTEPVEAAWWENSAGSRPVRIAGGRRLRWEWVAERTEEGRLAARTPDGLLVRQMQSRTLQVIPDEPPRVEIVAPQEDLWVEEKAEVPIVYEWSDDYGVDSLELNWRLEEAGRPVQTQPLSVPANMKSRGASETKWREAAARMKPGEEVFVWIAARDNNPFSPQTSASRILRFRMRSFQKEHEEVEAGVSRLSEKLTDLVEKQMQARRSREQKEWEKTLAGQRGVSQDLEKLLREYADWLSRAESDPYLDPSFLGEQRRLRQGLDQLFRQEAAQASAAASDLPAKETELAFLQEKMEQALTRAFSQMEESRKRQRMEEVLSRASTMEENARRIQEQLSSADIGRDPARLRELQEALQELSRALSELASALSRMPQDLPEEFVNHPSVKQLDLGSLQQSVDALSAALAKGDYEEAARIAKQLAEQASQALAALRGGREETARRSGELGEKISEQARKIREFIEEQRKILERTRQLEEARRRAWEEAAEDGLKKILERQKALGGKADEERKALQAHADPRIRGLDPTAWALRVQMSGLEKALAERDNLEQIPNGMKRVEEGWSALGSTIPARSGPLRQIAAAQGEIRRDLEELLHRRVPADAEASASLAPRQEKIAGGVSGVRKEIAGMAAETAWVDPETMDSLARAQKAMESSAEHLSQRQTRSSIPQQEKALAELSRAAEQLSASCQAIASAGGRPSGRVPSFRPISPSVGPGGGGIAGAAVGPVKLPSPEEFLPAKYLREEILQALREKYPAAHEETIRRYYRSLGAE